MNNLYSACFAVGLCLTGPAKACDMVPGNEVSVDIKEKVPGWMVWKFTPQAQAAGNMLTGHFKRRGFPTAAQEKAFLEGEIGKAAAALYKSTPTAVRLETPSAPVQQEAMRFKTDARVFSLTLDFGGTQISAPGYMRLNKSRKDIALIVAFAEPAHAGRANAIARSTMEHPGFDCGPGDGP